MIAEKYSMSFTTGTLFHQESVNLAGLYREKGDWNDVRNEVIVGNLLQARTINSAKHICREICSRLKKLNNNELTLLVEGEHQEQAYLLWLANEADVDQYLEQMREALLQEINEDKRIQI